MAKAAIICAECGHRTLQWHGRCPGCGSWDSLAEVRPGTRPAPAADVVPLAEIDPGTRPRLFTGIGELDRVLGGGLVPGSVVLLAGEPGVGKSTLTLQAATGLEEGGHRVLLVCGEESLEQVAGRARRIGINLGGLRATAAVELPSVLEQAPGSAVVVVDSIQAIADPGAQGEAGSVGQVRGCAAALARFARGSGTSVVLIGHVTKDGSVAGPRLLEHLVDAVLTFEGDRGHLLRMVRASKNRYGPTAEIGVFEMGTSGLREVADASQLFLVDRNAGIPGSAVGCVLEGRRPLALEVQTLMVDNRGSLPRRVANGVDAARLGVAAAVLESSASVRLGTVDVYASIPGGFRTAEPGLDLALAIALVSAKEREPVPDGLAAVGEVGLGGEVRTVPGMEARVAELVRLGFRRVLVPASVAFRSEQVEIFRVKDVKSSLYFARQAIG